MVFEKLLFFKLDERASICLQVLRCFCFVDAAQEPIDSSLNSFSVVQTPASLPEDKLEASNWRARRDSNPATRFEARFFGLLSYP